MKTCVPALILSLSSLTAYADVHAGDQAIYELSGYNFSDQTATLTRVVTAVDPANDKIYFQDVMVFNGETTVTEETGSIATQTAYEQTAASQAQCEQMASTQAGNVITTTYETLTVFGQTVNTCHAHILTAENDGTTTTEDVWLGAVPFGTFKVKINGTQATFGTMTLKNFTKN